MNDDRDHEPDVASMGYQLLWQAVALAALVAVPLLFLGGLWLMFQDYGYAEARAVRVLVPVAILASALFAWKKVGRKTS